MTDYGLPSISVVIPCWNAEKWIARAIQSVLDQDYPKKEVIVIDDGSTDGSLVIIKSFGDDLRWETGPNRGASAARNIGLRSTQAPLVLFLDADDYLDPGSLTAWVADADYCDMLIGPFAYEFEGVRQAAVRVPQSSLSADVLRAWIDGWFTPPCALLWRRDFLQDIGGWKEPSLARNQDGELAMRALLMGARTRISDRGMGIYVQHDSPHRVSRKSGRAVLATEIRVFTDLWDLALERGQSQLKQNFARVFYRLASQAYFAGEVDIGRSALHRARELGLHGHEGTFAHRAFASLLGLRMKSKIASAYRRLRRRLEPVNPR
jgi:glycosyltransferase involved in cell wall biosynthesis